MEVNLKGINIFYRDLGDGPQAVLLLHGWAMNGDSFLPLSHHLHQAHYRTIIPDLRGFGLSDKPLVGYHINDYTRDAIRLLRSAGVAKVDLIGHSFGGTGALYLAARIPHMVRRLVVIDTIPGAHCAAVDARIGRQFAKIFSMVQRVSSNMLPSLLDRVWRGSFVIPPSPHDLEIQHQLNQSAQRHAILSTLDTILTTDISPLLKKITAPTLIIRGSADPLLRNGADGLDTIPRARRENISHAGHYPHLENLSAVFPLVRDFLSTRSELST